jgi:type IV pilus assembly protein PilY1
MDVATGHLLGELDDTFFNAPLSGGVSLFTGDVGTIATRAYVTDEDGLIWRIDMSSDDISDWNAEPFHDIFYNAGPTDGQPAYEPPVVSTDRQGNPVVIQATGDMDNLDGLGANRVVSLREDITFASDGSVDDLTAEMNWEIPLRDGELVTGPLALFDGKVFFGSFLSANDPTNACALGSSRLWGVEYLRSEEDNDTYPRPALEVPDPNNAGETTLTHYRGPFENQIVMGVSVTQRRQCLDLQEVSETDPFLGTRTFKQVNDSGGGQFELVAQVSGGGTSSGGGSVSEIKQKLPAPDSFTQIQGFAGSVD